MPSGCISGPKGMTLEDRDAGGDDLVPAEELAFEARERDIAEVVAFDMSVEFAAEVPLKFCVNKVMNAGHHVVHLEYYERTGIARVELSWTKVGGSGSPNPTGGGVSAAPIRDGELVKGRRSQSVYFIREGVRYGIAQMNFVQPCGFEPKRIRTVDDSVLNKLPQSPVVISSCAGYHAPAPPPPGPTTGGFSGCPLVEGTPGTALVRIYDRNNTLVAVHLKGVGFSLRYAETRGSLPPVGQRS